MFAGDVVMLDIVMSPSTADLPCDPDDLRRVAGDLQRDVAALSAEIHAKTLLIEKLKMQLAVLRRAQFGRSSEKLDREVEQLELLIGDIEETEGEKEAQAETTKPDKSAAPSSSKRRKPPGRTPLPEHLPQETIIHEPACICPACGGEKFSKLGADEREVLEYVPSHFKRVLHVRPKMSCRGCETIVQAPMPTLPIEKGRPGPALLAHVLVSKFGDHQPLNRQSDIYARGGVDINRGTMANWVGHMAAYLEHVAEAIGRHVRAGAATHADDTPVPVLDQDAARPGLDDYGLPSVTNGPLGRARRPPHTISIRRIARPNTREACSSLVVDSSMPMATRASPISICPIQRPACRSSSKSLAGRTRGAKFMTFMSRQARPPRAMRWT